MQLHEEMIFGQCYTGGIDKQSETLRVRLTKIKSQSDWHRSALDCGCFFRNCLADQSTDQTLFQHRCIVHLNSLPRASRSTLWSIFPRTQAWISWKSVVASMPAPFMISSTPPGWKSRYGVMLYTLPWIFKECFLGWSMVNDSRSTRYRRPAICFLIMLRQFLLRDTEDLSIRARHIRCTVHFSYPIHQA